MRHIKRWWKKFWQTYFAVLGISHIIISLHFVQKTFAIKNGGFAAKNSNRFDEVSWTRNETKVPIKATHYANWKKSNRKDGITFFKQENGYKEKQIFRREFMDPNMQENMGFKREKTSSNSIKEDELINFVNNKDKNRILFDGNLNKRDKILSHSWAIKIPTKNVSILDKEYLNRIADRIAIENGLINFGAIGGLHGYYYFVHNNFFHDLDFNHSNDDVKLNITKFLKKHPEIEWVKHEQIRIRKKRTLEFKDQFFPSQWHLVNLKFVNHDINVTGVWEHNITGRGVVVSVIDDGVEWTNPDILDNYSPEGSWDLNSNDGDPMPRVDEAGLNHHGTRCAGEIAAVANEYCAVGVAYEARVSGIRILDGPMTDSLEAMAFNTKMEVNDIYSCSWGPDDNGKTVDGPHRLAQAALAHGVMAGRRGYGSIYVVASGNGGHFKDNCNFDGYANSIFTVTIGAVDELGQMPYYAEHCAAMLAVTYSSGQGHQRNIVTTDWRLGTGTGCTDRHTGTSAAAPLAAGIIALMLQVRKCLTWRDIQHIIVFTAVKVPIDKDEWQRNGAGFSHSHKHGFGLLNSWKLVTVAKMWESVPFMTSWSSPILNINKEIPSVGQLIEVFVVEKDMVNDVITLEHVTITVNLKHPCRGDVVVNLISPSGTISKLATPRKYDRSSDGFVDWTFSSVRYWGERPEGNWKIIIEDEANQPKRGQLKSWRLTFYGSAMTSREIQQRRRLVKEVSSGKYLSEQGPPCQPPPSPLDERIAMSSRFLKVLLLLSGFFFLVCTYFLLETVFTSNGNFRTIDLNESDIHAVDGFDIKNFLPKELAAHDQVRLNILLESGGSKSQLKSSPSVNAVLNESKEETVKAASVSIIVTPDEMNETKEFEERLRRALEQSRMLQIQQMSQIKNIENEIASTNDDGFEIFDLKEKKAKKLKKPRKLKGILKKPKQ